jgi:predicted metal-dependent phosphoesterase TrpH
VNREEKERKAKYDADLHCHTTASDGILSPSEIMMYAAKRGLQAVAITDHDTTLGWEEAEKAAYRAGVKLLKGLEINTEWRGKEVHILGYGLNDDNNNLKIRLQELRSKRTDRIGKIIEKLKGLNIRLSLADVEQCAKGESLGRPHVVAAMIAKGYLDSYQEGFDKYLSVGAPAYVPRYKLTPSEAIIIIREAGGVAVLAHPGNNVSQDDIQQWVEDGLQGIEVSHPDHTLNHEKKYRKIAAQYGLITTGGSDYHGPGVKPGIELGDWGVSLDLVQQLEQLITSA